MVGFHTKCLNARISATKLIYPLGVRKGKALGVFTRKVFDSHVWNMGIWHPRVSDERMDVLEI
jgi:hypothetical protein